MKENTIKLYRLCRKGEVEEILKSRRFTEIGHKCENDSKKNTHIYNPNVNYMHFFANELSLLYLYPSKEKLICIYDIPCNIAKEAEGKGRYLDFVNFQNMQEVKEYAIKSQNIKFEYLKKIYKISQSLDFDYIPEEKEIYDNLTCVYDASKLRKTKNQDEELERD